MIEINNLTATIVDKKFLKGIAEKVLKGENKKKEYLSVAFVKKKRIRELNKKYRKEDRATDVLSFSKDSYSAFKIPGSIEGLGEIIICPEIIKKNAKRYNSTLKKELARVLIHGILHLLGYEHEEGGKDADKMRKKEEFYLSLI